MSTWYAEMQKYRLAGLAGNDGAGQRPIPYSRCGDGCSSEFRMAVVTIMPVTRSDTATS